MISAVDVGWAAIVLNLIPAFGLLSSVIFLGEDPTRTGTIGACLIGGSVIYFTISDSRGRLSPGPSLREGGERDATELDRFTVRRAGCAEGDLENAVAELDQQVEDGRRGLLAH